MVSKILLDIEGTTTDINFVHKTLFPFARQALVEMAAEERFVDQEIESYFQVVKAKHLTSDASTKDTIDLLLKWTDEDKKDTDLKNIQGIIWESGYKDGTLKAHVYPEVADKMRAWKAEGKSIYIYSSGSVKAQKLLFGYSLAGDLTSYIDGYFDTNIGHKREATSYENIVKTLEVPASEILFLSDVKEELAAAKSVGMQVMLVARDIKVLSEMEMKVIKDFNEITTAAKLRIFNVDGSLKKAENDNRIIAKELDACGVLFEQWETTESITASSTDEEILKGYASSIKRLSEAYGYQSHDVIHMRDSHPDREALRQKFITEHVHSEAEVRFFVRGKGLFCLNIKDHVYLVLCEAGDLISVPAGTKHWFDMSAQPNFSCIRLFTGKDGWIAQYTNSGFEKNFPIYA